MSEFWNITRKVSFVIAMGLGAAACGGGAQSVDATPKAVTSGITREVHYYDDGTRIISFHGAYEHVYYEAPSPIYEFCDTDGSMVEQPLGKEGYPGGTTRYENYPACSDGRLTAEDFVHPVK